MEAPLAAEATERKTFSSRPADDPTVIATGTLTPVFPPVSCLHRGGLENPGNYKACLPSPLLPSLPTPSLSIFLSHPLSLPLLLFLPPTFFIFGGNKNY